MSRKSIRRRELYVEEGRYFSKVTSMVRVRVGSRCWQEMTSMSPPGFQVPEVRNAMITAKMRIALLHACFDLLVAEITCSAAKPLRISLNGCTPCDSRLNRELLS